MTKADRIRQLAKHEIFSDREIAETIAREFGSCCEAYVRTCARQRVGGHISEGDRRYRDSARGKLAAQKKYARFKEEHGCAPSTLRKRIDPEYRARAYAASRLWVANNLERRREIARGSERRKRARLKASRAASERSPSAASEGVNPCSSLRKLALERTITAIIAEAKALAEELRVTPSEAMCALLPSPES